VHLGTITFKPTSFTDDLGLLSRQALAAADSVPLSSAQVQVEVLIESWNIFECMSIPVQENSDSLLATTAAEDSDKVVLSFTLMNVSIAIYFSNPVGETIFPVQPCIALVTDPVKAEETSLPQLVLSAESGLLIACIPLH
jgi:hypothetical protein